MNKQDLIAAVADTTGQARADVGKTLETMLSIVGKALSPRTGEPLQIGSTSQPKFRAGKVLRELVN